MAPRRVYSTEQLLQLLDEAVVAGGKDRTHPGAAEYWTSRLQEGNHPLSHNFPDEPLTSWARKGMLGRDLRGLSVLDVGAGNGRNALWLAAQGAKVTALDIAGELLETYEGREGVHTVCADFLRDELPARRYDFVYDSGCLHHVPPHRRGTYLERLRSLVTTPDQLYGIAAFASEVLDVAGDDEALMRPGTVNGYTFSLEQITAMFTPWRAIEVRRFRSDIEGTYGPDYLNAALFHSKSSP